MSRRLGIAGVPAAVLLALALGASSGAGAQGPQVVRASGDVDVRAGLGAYVGRTAAQRTAVRRLPGTHIVFNWREGTPVGLTRYGGYLSGPHGATAETIARRFLATHSALYRLSVPERRALVVASEHVGTNGVTVLTLRQTDRGRLVFGSGIKFGINRHGRVLTVNGPYYLDASATGVPAFGAAEAVRIAAEEVKAPVPSLTVVSAADGPTRRTVFANTVATGLYRPNPITAELVTFPMPGDRASRIAWRTYIEVSPVEAYETLVDALTGRLLFRENGYKSSGPEGNVFRVQHPDISGAMQQITSFAGAPFDDDGWVTDDNTDGNNVNAYQDKDGDDASDFQPDTPDSPDPAYQHFNYNFTNAFETSGGTDVITDQAAVVTQMFYFTNVYHDYFYGLGFDESSLNFQVDNFGRGGSGGDPILAEADDSWATAACNANFNTPADGSSPRMQMFVGKTSCSPPNQFMHRAMNGDTTFHEISHGLSERLIGDGTIGSGAQTNAMGEGWGDYIAISFWDDPVYGDYNNNDTTNGVRRFGYGTSPLMFSDLCDNGSCEEHDDGEIWAKVLWEMRVRLVAKYGYSSDRPVSPPGSPAGNYRADQLVVHGMDMTATSSSFLTARDQILAADTADYAGANQCLIWGAFASREMGFSATSAADQTTITTATDGPASCTPVADAGGDQTSDEGDTVNFDGSGSTENGDGPFVYEWDWNNDGTFDATGKTASHVFGDNGAFTVGMKVTNANGFFDTDSLLVTVDNVAPTATINPPGPFIAHAGETVNFSGDITNPGSDDETATWDWDDGAPSPDVSETFLVNPPSADPPNSPSVQPRNFTDTASHAFGDACLYVVTFAATDDDGGTDSDTATVLITGNATVLENAGYWQTQYEPRPTAFPEALRLCYLEIVSFMSDVFGSGDPVALADAEDAFDALFVGGAGGNARQLLDRQLLAAWLNFANGAFELGTPVDTDGNGTNDSTFGAAIAAAEAVRLNPASTRAQLLAQKAILERING